MANQFHVVLICKPGVKFCDSLQVDAEHMCPVEAAKLLRQPAADQNLSIYGLEYVRLEFLRLGKKNLTFRTYPTDHFFIEATAINGRDTVISYKTKMMQDVVEWIVVGDDAGAK